MGLRQDLQLELQHQQGLSGSAPVRSTLTDGGLTLEIDFLAVDSLGCSFEQLTLAASAMNGAAFDALKTWARSLSRRITYLLEQIGLGQHLAVVVAQHMALGRGQEDQTGGKTKGGKSQTCGSEEDG